MATRKDIDALLEKLDRQTKAVRRHFRESGEVANFVAAGLPVQGDWSPTLVAEYIAQSCHNNQLIGGAYYRFDDMRKRDQFAVAKSICERLVKAGRAEKALGVPLRGHREVMTYNGV